MLLEGFHSLMGWVYLALLVMSVFALVHAALQRDDAFVATDKQTKRFWLVVLGAAVAVQFFLAGFLLLTIVAVIATIVYLVDVRPTVQAVSRRGGGGSGGAGSGWSSSDGPYGPYNGGR